MWFAKLFGGRDDGANDEPPTAVAPPSPSASSMTAARHPLPVQGAKSTAKAPKVKGFDPYNSGSFERSTAWERVQRRS